MRVDVGVDKNREKRRENSGVIEKVSGGEVERTGGRIVEEGAVEGESVGGQVVGVDGG